jgi:hypothetical protein
MEKQAYAISDEIRDVGPYAMEKGGLWLMPMFC